MGLFLIFLRPTKTMMGVFVRTPRWLKVCTDLSNPDAQNPNVPLKVLVVRQECIVSFEESIFFYHSITLKVAMGVDE